MLQSTGQKPFGHVVLEGGLRLLVVDDDPLLREFAIVHLGTSEGYVDVACDGIEADALLNERPYDLVLLDIEMPRLDGFALLRKIRATERLKSLPVIMLTAHEGIVSIDQAYQCGADSFALKPVNWRLLAYQIRYVLRASRLEQSRLALAATSSKNALAGSTCVSTFLQSVIREADLLAKRLSPNESEIYGSSLLNLLNGTKQVLSTLQDAIGITGQTVAGGRRLVH